MKLLDCFCKAGGCTKGYQQAGFEVVGIDIEPQPRYIGDDFVQMDALEALRILIGGGYIVGKSGRRWYLDDFNALSGSPKCQFGTGMQHLVKARNGSYPEHENQIPAVRELLQLTGKPYVIENVDGSRKHLINPIMLCGKTFGLKTYRHRWFEISPFWFLAPSHIAHQDQTPSAGNGISPKGFISICGTGGVRGMTSQEIIDYWSTAMGIDWMTRAELAEAIPPAYTRWIGEQLINQLRLDNRAAIVQLRERL